MLTVCLLVALALPVRTAEPDLPVPSPAPSSAPVDVGDAEKIRRIADRMDHLNPSVVDWTCDVAIEARVDIAMLSLPLDLHGRSYYLAPDRYKVEVQNLPRLLERYRRAFRYLAWRPIDLTQFTAALMPDETVDGRAQFVIRLQKKGGDLRGVTLWVDKESFTSPRRRYALTNERTADVTYTWRKEQDRTVLDQMAARITVPQQDATATVLVRYSGYAFNCGLDESLFIEKEGP